MDIKPITIKPQQIVAVLDRSGSMSSIVDDAIGGFNSFIAEQKKSKIPAEVTLILFDNEYDVVYKSIPLDDVKELDRTTFVPRGMTALNDAIGRAITSFQNEEDVILAILTDGHENSSREWNQSQIKVKLDEMRKKDWDVQYLAANQDAFAVGAAYGINKAVNFDQSAYGASVAFSSMSANSTSMRGAYASKYGITTDTDSK